jgi:hypothetical protein
MVKPLFNSHGWPSAYVHEDDVFRCDNQGVDRFLGRLEGNEVWRGVYVGEIVIGNRLLYREAEGREPRPVGKVPSAPGVPIQPWGMATCALPEGFRDVVLVDGKQPATDAGCF